MKRTHSKSRSLLWVSLVCIVSAATVCLSCAPCDREIETIEITQGRYGIADADELQRLRVTFLELEVDEREVYVRYEKIDQPGVVYRAEYARRKRTSRYEERAGNTNSPCFRSCS